MHNITNKDNLDVRESRPRSHLLLYIHRWETNSFQGEYRRLLKHTSYIVHGRICGSSNLCPNIQYSVTNFTFRKVELRIISTIYLFLQINVSFILGGSTRRDRNARMLRTLTRKANDKRPFHSFIRALEMEFWHVANTLHEYHQELKEIEQKGLVRLVRDKCIYCLFVQYLNPEDVTHALYEKNIIAYGDLEILNNIHLPEEERNDRLLHILQSHERPVEAISRLKVALEKKYRYVVDKIQSVTSSKDLPTSCNCTGKDNSICDDEPTVAQNNDEIILHKLIGKPHLKNKKIIELCKDIWDILFKLRETGNWLKFRQFTDAALKKYDNNYDVQSTAS